MNEQDIIDAMRAGATLYQEGDDVWYLAGVNYQRQHLDAAICERLERQGIISDQGDDERPG